MKKYLTRIMKTSKLLFASTLLMNTFSIDATAAQLHGGGLRDELTSKDGKVKISSMYTRLQQAIVLLVDCNTAFVNNAVKRIDSENKTVKPFTKNGRTLVPFRFLSENMGATVDWDGAKNEVQISKDGHTIKLVIGSNEIRVDQEIKQLDVSPMIMNGRVFVPIRAIGEALGKKFIYHDGLIIISDDEQLIDVTKDVPVVKLLIHDLKKLGEVDSIEDAVKFEEVNGFEGRLFEDPRFSYTMPYRIFVPEHYDPNKKYPFVLSLHGFGNRGDDNLKQITENAPHSNMYATAAVQQKDPCIILAPQAINVGRTVFFDPTLPGGEGKPLSYTVKTVDYDKIVETESYRMAMQLFYNTLEKYSIDSNRLYVTGHSMGGFSTFYFATRHHDLFAAAMPLAGAGDPSKAHLLSDVAVWAHHGEVDSIVPADGSRIMNEALAKVGGAEHKYTEYPNVKHDVHRFVYKVDTNGDGIPDVIEWMLKQRKSNVHLTHISVRDKL
jgi:predicted esterase